uniref:Retrotransposon protein, putative, Ty3-gypsy subclass n=2 Tax=Oryza sativa subsp. japonica TaxID=39947 RepID=Q8S5R5_ORYSJ|nr:Hypothetical protein [Oryza sativa Japonica Group]AAP51744.1 retrotransposon protein, putative, Ty3-gypsy subclass [Oryza sativa Japonica Group]
MAKQSLVLTLIMLEPQVDKETRYNNSMATTIGLTSSRRGGAGKRGPLVSGSGESGSPWTGTTRVVHRRSTGPTAQIALGPIGRAAVEAAAGLGSASKPTGRPGANGGGTRASRCQRRHPAAEATAQKRRESGISGRRQRPKATASAGGGDARGNRGSKGKGKESSPKGTTASGDEERRREVDTRRTATGTT